MKPKDHGVLESFGFDQNEGDLQRLGRNSRSSCQAGGENYCLSICVAVNIYEVAVIRVAYSHDEMDIHELHAFICLMCNRPADALSFKVK